MYYMYVILYNIYIYIYLKCICIYLYIRPKHEILKRIFKCFIILIEKDKQILEIPLRQDTKLSMS